MSCIDAAAGEGIRAAAGSDRASISRSTRIEATLRDLDTYNVDVRTRLLRSFVVISVALLLALAPSASIASRFKIKADTTDDVWDPEHVFIHRGDVIVWKNPDDRFHDLTSYGRNWDKEQGLPPGESTMRKFKKTGVYKFRCRIHSAMQDGVCDGMCGLIHVQR
jgi:plastocyanin